MSLMRLRLGSPLHVEDVFKKKKKSLKHAKYIAGTQNQLFGWNVRNEVAEGGLKCQMSARGNGGREMSPRKKAEVNLMVMSGMKGNQERLESGRPVGTRLGETDFDGQQ